MRRVLVAGRAEGPVIRLSAPLSFWGGFDSETGRVAARHHPEDGLLLTGAILIMERARGSSSAASVIAEAIRLGTAPAAIILQHPDPILTAGAMVASRLYSKTCPIVVLPAAETDDLSDGMRVSVDTGRKLVVSSE